MELDHESDVESVYSEEPVENRVIQPEAQAERYDYSAQTDLSGVPICGLCTRLIEENQSKTVLACSHSLHTFCLLTCYWHHDIRRCMKCDVEYYNPQDVNEEVWARFGRLRNDKRQKKVQSLNEQVMANKDLLADLKYLKKSFRETSGAAKRFRSFGRQLRSEYQEETKTLQDILKATKKRYKERLMKSPQMAEWRKKKARTGYYMRLFNQKYRNFPFETLTVIRELKLPTRWNLRAALHIYSYTINRWFRIWI